MILLPVFTSMRWWQGIIAGFAVWYVYFGIIESLLKSIGLIVAAEEYGHKSWLRRFLMFCVVATYLVLKAACCAGIVAILLANLRWYVDLAAFMAVGVALWVIEFIPSISAFIVMDSKKDESSPPLPRVEGTRKLLAQPSGASSASSQNPMNEDDYDEDVDDDPDDDLEDDDEDFLEDDDDFDDASDDGGGDEEEDEEETSSPIRQLSPEEMAKCKAAEELAISRLRARHVPSAEEERAEQLAEAIAKFQAKLDAIGKKKGEQ